MASTKPINSTVMVLDETIRSVVDIHLINSPVFTVHRDKHVIVSLFVSNSVKTCIWYFINKTSKLQL
jgi:hypothetical protein